MKEREIIAMQNEQWRYGNLAIVLVGSTWKAYNESAHVIASLTGYKISRKITGPTPIDLVVFRGAAKKKVMDKLEVLGCYPMMPDEKTVIYCWHNEVPEVQNFTIKKLKQVRNEVKLDIDTARALTRIQANGGFAGKSKASKSEIIRYAIRHFYDNKPFDLSEADSLARSIGGNREQLVTALKTLTRLTNELNAMGINLNQIAHQINYVMLLADENGEKLGERADTLNAFYGEVCTCIAEINYQIDLIKPEVEPAMNAITKAMEDENEIMNRLLI